MPNGRITGPKDRGVITKREFYTMSVNCEGDEAEITMYGDIVEDRPRDWWGELIEGNFIILSEFLEDLNRLLKAKRISIRLNSCGGDAYAAIPIHNRLRELARDRKIEITVIVDGVAMSGGSLIMCAANRVLVNPSSLIMIHKCWCFMFGGFDADELRRIASANDAVDKAQAAVYMRKTGMDEETILSMMGEETYMTGREALEKGFADALTEDEPVKIAASADRQTLCVNGQMIPLLFPLPGLPESIPTINTETTDAAPDPKGNKWSAFVFGGKIGKKGASAINPEKIGATPDLKNNDPSAVIGGADHIQATIPDSAAAASDLKNSKQSAPAADAEGGKTMATTLEELRKENPELANKLMAEAQASISSDISKQAAEKAAADERERIKGIDEISDLFDDETVREAKYGASPCTAQEMSYRAAQKAASEGKKFMADLENDAEMSGAQSVGSAPGDDEASSAATKDMTPEQRMEAARAEVKNLLGKKDAK